MMAGATVHFQVGTPPPCIPVKLRIRQLVFLQDYNSQVLHELTMPNVLANLARLPDGRTRPSARYFSGDWKHLGELMSSKGLGGHYDIVLTSESIYAESSHRRLLECIKQVLRGDVLFIWGRGLWGSLSKWLGRK